MQIQAIASDLDGTLLNDQHTLGAKTINVLSQLNKLGIELIIATGRNYRDVEKMLDKAQLEASIISSNGAITHNKQRKIFTENPIPTELTQRILAIPYDFKNVYLNIYQYHNWYIDKPIIGAEIYHPDSKFSFEVMDFKQSDLLNKVHKFCYISRNINKLDEIKNIIEQTCIDHVNLTTSSPDCIEITNQHANKGLALVNYLNSLNIPTENCIAFGDNLNDLEMLSMTGKGYLMQNSNPLLKQLLPKNQQIGTNKDEAIANYLIDIFDL